MKFVCRIAVALLLTMPLSVMAADAEIRAALFADADQLLAQARDASAQLLAPRSFARALVAYRDAEDHLARSQSLDKIRADLQIASEALRQATTTAAAVAAGLEASLRAREAALSSRAPEYARERFAQAEEAMVKLTSDLERGRNRDLEKFDKELAGEFRQAELEAIKRALLADTRGLLSQAQELRADRFAPITLQRAKTLLAEAEAALESDRYDADRPRALAGAADIEARHAIYLARRFAEIRDGRSNVEALVLEWEESLARLAAVADATANFDRGPKPVTDTVHTYIRELQKEVAGLKTALSDREQQLAQMEIEIRDLEQRLGGVARERSALEEELERRALRLQRYRQVEELFEDDEALVIRESGKITLRLLGLKFDVGESDINAANFPLLAKVGSAIRIFPRARLVVDGHTDSFGSDDKNQQLSRDRAEAVRQYLMVSMRLNPGQISAVGHGESRPIANNETKEGRALNRRIELILFTDEEP